MLLNCETGMVQYNAPNLPFLAVDVVNRMFYDDKPFRYSDYDGNPNHVYSVNFKTIDSAVHFIGKYDTPYDGKSSFYGVLLDSQRLVVSEQTLRAMLSKTPEFSNRFRTYFCAQKLIDVAAIRLAATDYKREYFSELNGELHHGLSVSAMACLIQMTRLCRHMTYDGHYCGLMAAEIRHWHDFLKAHGELLMLDSETHQSITDYDQQASANQNFDTFVEAMIDMRYRSLDFRVIGDELAVNLKRCYRRPILSSEMTTSKW